MIALVKVSEIETADADNVSVNINVEGSWGRNLSDNFTVNLSGITPAQAITGIKNRVIAWANTAQGGGVVITAGNVWIFGGPQ